MASSSLQYSSNWQHVAVGLADAALSHLYITRLPVLTNASSFVVLQRPHRHGYETEYESWFLNRSELLDQVLATGMRLEREFLIDETPHVPRAPEQASYRGFLFVRGSRDERYV
jgi:hypothetical protein